MLKHVHASTSSLTSAYRCKQPARDAVSLTSTMSYGSSSGQEAMSSRSSSSSSLQEIGLHPHKAVVKVYSRVLCADMEYKTLSIGPETTSKEVVRMLLNKFRMKHRDPNLFYLIMEVWMRKTGVPIRTVMVLDDEARPAELQACHPRGESKYSGTHAVGLHIGFSLQMRRGGLVKVYDSCLMAGSLYKSLLVSDRTTAEELIQLLLHCYNSKERPSKFSVFEVCTSKKYERKLHPHDYPLLIQQQWPSPEHFAFYLRRNAEINTKRKLPWVKIMDTTGNVSFRLSIRDEVVPSAIHSPTLKPSFNNYENYFYI